MQWIGEESVLDVGGDQLLVLLLVLEAQGHAPGGFVVHGLRQKPFDGVVDVSPVGEDLIERWPGEAGAQLLLGHVAKRVVVGVEEPEKVGMEGLVAGKEVAQQECLKEPGGVGEVPFNWTRLRTRLHHQILG